VLFAFFGEVQPASGAEHIKVDKGIHLLCSSAMQPLSCAESQFMRGLFNSDRICPCHCSLTIPDQKEKIPLQLIEYGVDSHEG
jgi:hypothetical protein